MRQYHDTRWCRPVHAEEELFAMLILEGAQAGLSWSTIIEKEAGYREAYEGFDPARVARFSAGKQEELLMHPGIVRNRLKIRSSVRNAVAFLRVQEEFGGFDPYIWGFTEGKVIDHHLKRIQDMPATSDLSRRVSSDLRKRGFSFVGPTIIYSYLQGIGVINDHVEDCSFR